MINVDRIIILNKLTVIPFKTTNQNNWIVTHIFIDATDDGGGVGGGAADNGDDYCVGDGDVLDDDDDDDKDADAAC